MLELSKSVRMKIYLVDPR